MTPDFLQGFYSCLLLEGIGLAVWHTYKLYMRNRVKTCDVCQSPNIDKSGRSLFPVESLAECSKCGETMPKSHAPANSKPIR